LWGYVASAGENERKFFIIGGCVMAFLTFRALRRKEPAEESAESESDFDFGWDSSEKETNVQEVVAKRKEHSPELQKILEVGTGWPVGTRAPEFALPTLAGETRSLQSLREEGKTICIVFSSPYCESCRAILPQLNAWMQEYDRSLNIILISRGGTKENVAKLKDFEASRVLLQPGFEHSEAYGVSATPAALLVDTDGVIQSRLAIGRDEIKQLISSSTKQSESAR
jgi:thiol-disulfide isomerase/thioredoxin